MKKTESRDRSFAISVIKRNESAENRRSCAQEGIKANKRKYNRCYQKEISSTAINESKNRQQQIKNRREAKHRNENLQRQCTTIKYWTLSCNRMALSSIHLALYFAICFIVAITHQIHHFSSSRSRTDEQNVSGFCSEYQCQCYFTISSVEFSR